MMKNITKIIFLLLVAVSSIVFLPQCKTKKATQADTQNDSTTKEVKYVRYRGEKHPEHVVQALKALKHPKKRKILLDCNFSNYPLLGRRAYLSYKYNNESSKQMDAVDDLQAGESVMFTDLRGNPYNKIYKYSTIKWRRKKYDFFFREDREKKRIYNRTYFGRMVSTYTYGKKHLLNIICNEEISDYSFIKSLKILDTLKYEERGHFVDSSKISQELKIEEIIYDKKYYTGTYRKSRNEAKIYSSPIYIIKNLPECITKIINNTLVLEAYAGVLGIITPNGSYYLIPNFNRIFGKETLKVYERFTKKELAECLIQSIYWKPLVRKKSINSIKDMHYGEKIHRSRAIKILSFKPIKPQNPEALDEDNAIHHPSWSEQYLYSRGPKDVLYNYKAIIEIKGDNGRTYTDDVYLRIKGKHIIEITNKEGDFYYKMEGGELCND